ncbi:hypothetical protein OG21DRAFT_210805 [Imleria badia]|nr:hypothetical protein OG21DRAFT_210805 [Imleria badia]
MRSVFYSTAGQSVYLVCPVIDGWPRRYLRLSLRVRHCQAKGTFMVNLVRRLGGYPASWINIMTWFDFYSPKDTAGHSKNWQHLTGGFGNIAHWHLSVTSFPSMRTIAWYGYYPCVGGTMPGSQARPSEYQQEDNMFFPLFLDSSVGVQWCYCVFTPRLGTKCPTGISIVGAVVHRPTTVTSAATNLFERRIHG